MISPSLTVREIKVLMVHRGVNKAGGFLELSVYAEGGRRGVLRLPKGYNGRGWR